MATFPDHRIVDRLHLIHAIYQYINGLRHGEWRSTNIIYTLTQIMAMNGRLSMEQDDFSRVPQGFAVNLMLTQHSRLKRKRNDQDDDATIELTQETNTIWWTCTFPNCRWKNHTIYVSNDTNNRRRDSMKQAHLARHK